MQYYINKVREFNKKYGYPAPETITPVTHEQSELRIRLIKEELKELREAIDMGFKRSEIIKELCDVIYVYAGSFVERGENTGDFLFVRPMLDVPRVDNAHFEAINNIGIFGIDYLQSDVLSKDVRDVVRAVCLRYNIDFDADGLKKAFDIVHASNMSKGTNGQPVFVDGKLQKGEDYVKADLSYLDKPDGDTVTIQKIIIESKGEPSVGIFSDSWEISHSVVIDADKVEYFRAGLENAFEYVAEDARAIFQINGVMEQ
jgi:hypothetical protein